MKVAELSAVGPAEEVVKCVEADDPGAPGPGQVTIRMEACSINPADLLMIEGKYASIPETPCPLGIEGAGVIEAVGPGVTRLAPGDPVMSLGRTNWAQKLLVDEAAAVKLLAGTDLAQAAMLKVNVATAELMLTDFVNLSPGDWVIQNAANSGVGTNLIKLAKSKGLKTVNVVRRAGLEDSIAAIGGDVTVVDGDDLGAKVAEATGGAAIKLGIDAVGGGAVRRLGDALADGGTIVNYGLLSGEDCRIGSDQLIFRSITVVGFWLAKLMRAMTPDQIEAMYAGLSAKIADGTLAVPVEASYTLDQISDAMAHAKRGGRSGKIQLRPNG